MKLCIEADGGSRGNPGVAGSGTVLYDATHTTVLRRIADYVGTATNNVAEYHGLLNGLRAARDMGATEVEVFMDSKLVVEQMSGRWKIKHPDMKTLALEAQNIARQFDSVVYTWVPRSSNKLADELANTAMDAGADGAELGFVLDEQVVGVSDAGSTEVSADAGPAGAPTIVWNGATTRPTRLILLRHGQTEMSAARQYSGISDPELTELGIRQAQAAAERLGAKGGIEHIVCSPLVRARATADMCAKALGLDVDVHEGLIEMNFGNWDGLTFGQAHESDPDLHTAWLGDTSIAPPGGESIEASDQRICETLEALREQYGATNILVVSHVTPIKAILRRALGGGPEFFHRLHLDLASLSIAEFYADGPTCVRLVNDTSHLR